MKNAERIASTLVATQTMPVLFEGRQIVVLTSVGIALYPEQETLATELFSKADEAMYKAKKKRWTRLGFLRRYDAAKSTLKLGLMDTSYLR